MRRVTRYLSTLCTAASLLLCVAVCVLWAGTYAGRDVAVVQFAGEPWHLGFERGWLVMDNTPVVAAATEALRAHDVEAQRVADLHTRYHEELTRELNEGLNERDALNAPRNMDLLLRHDIPGPSAGRDAARRSAPPTPPPPVPPAP